MSVQVSRESRYCACEDAVIGDRTSQNERALNSQDGLLRKTVRNLYICACADQCTPQ